MKKYRSDNGKKKFYMRVDSMRLTSDCVLN